MDIEEKIRSRIEAVLIHDAKIGVEMKEMADADEPLESEPFSEERNLYQRIISNYRAAVSEANARLEENIGFLSGFCRIIDTIKGKDDFRETCTHIVDCVLQDLGAEYCGLVLRENKEESFHLEGIREGRKFFRLHAGRTLFGSREFEDAIFLMLQENNDCCNLDDVYKDPRFHDIDFPGVVRSLMCVPISLNESFIGCFVLSHSRPHYFSQHHIRVLRIVAGLVAHLQSLTCERRRTRLTFNPPATEPKPDVLSIALLDFETRDLYRSIKTVDKESVRRIKSHLQMVLKGHGHVLFHQDGDLLVLLPGVTAESLPTVVCTLEKEFVDWKARQGERFAGTSMNVGFSTCNDDDEWSRTLEIAALAMRCEPGEELGIAEGTAFHT